MLMMIIGMSLLYSYVMSYLHISQSVAEIDCRDAPAAMGIAGGDPRHGRRARLFSCRRLSIILMTAPIILPPLRAAHFDIIWFGNRHDHRHGDGPDPPAGRLETFSSSAMSRPIFPLSEVIWGTLPFVLLMMLAVVVLCFVPEISTALPDLVMGPDGGR